MEGDEYARAWARDRGEETLEAMGAVAVNITTLQKSLERSLDGISKQLDGIIEYLEMGVGKKRGTNQ